MNKEFEVHKLNVLGLGRASAIAEIFDATLIAIKLLCPAGRELSIVATKLEEACFFAKKAMACETSNQE